MMMYLGDVTGHGVPAGIISSIANALFFDSALEGEDLKKTLKKCAIKFLPAGAPLTGISIVLSSLQTIS